LYWKERRFESQKNGLKIEQKHKSLTWQKFYENIVEIKVRICTDIFDYIYNSLKVFEFEFSLLQK